MKKEKRKKCRGGGEAQGKSNKAAMTVQKRALFFARALLLLAAFTVSGQRAGWILPLHAAVHTTTKIILPWADISKAKTLIVYSDTFLENQEKDVSLSNIDNLRYFTTVGVLNRADVAYAFLIKPGEGAEQFLPNQRNVLVASLDYPESHSCDFGSFLQLILQTGAFKGSTVILISSNIRGPFVPPWIQTPWYSLLTTVSKRFANKDFLVPDLHCGGMSTLTNNVLLSTKPSVVRRYASQWAKSCETGRDDVTIPVSKVGTLSYFKLSDCDKRRLRTQPPMHPYDTMFVNYNPGSVKDIKRMSASQRDIHKYVQILSSMKITPYFRMKKSQAYMKKKAAEVAVSAKWDTADDFDVDDEFEDEEDDSESSGGVNMMLIALIILVIAGAAYVVARKGDDFFPESGDKIV